MTESYLENNPRIISNIKSIIKEMANENYDVLHTKNLLGDASPQEYIERSRDIFRGKLITIPPDDALHKSYVFGLPKDSNDKYAIDVFLWCNGEQNDAVATFCVRRNPKSDAQAIYLYDLKIP
jgi:hypothetical protein